MNLEVAQKLNLIRNALTETEAQGIRFKGTDWFAWVTAGASHRVLLTAETGVAEVLVTQERTPWRMEFAATQTKPAFAGFQRNSLSLALRGLRMCRRDF